MKKFITTIGLLIAIAASYAQAQNPVFKPDLKARYWIKTKLADLRLAVADSQLGGKVVVQSPNSDKSQVWKFVKKGDVYHLVSAKTGYQLDIHGGSASPNGDGVCQAQPNDTGAQDWVIEATDTDYFAIKCTLSKLEGHYLDVFGGNRVSGAKVCHAFGSDNEAGYNKTDSQLWKFIQVPFPVPDPKEDTKEEPK